MDALLRFIILFDQNGWVDHLRTIGTQANSELNQSD
jgi:hypothetical protein